MPKIFLLASGSGSNAEAIVHYFQGYGSVKVVGIGTNNPQAGVIQRAERLGIPCRVFDRTYFKAEDGLLAFLKSEKIDLLVLAGFLWLIPESFVRAYPDRIINIHPSLLPAYGGKGFYGNRVHEAVLADRQRISGITVHRVNEHFDEGAVVFQGACHVSADDTVSTLSDKIHALEHKFYPVVIRKILQSPE